MQCRVYMCRLFVGQCGDATAEELAALFGPFAARGLRALHLLRKGCAMILFERWAEGKVLMVHFKYTHLRTLSGRRLSNVNALSSSAQFAQAAVAYTEIFNFLILQPKLLKRLTMDVPGFTVADPLLSRLPTRNVCVRGNRQSLRLHHASYSLVRCLCVVLIGFDPV